MIHIRKKTIIVTLLLAFGLQSSMQAGALDDLGKPVVWAACAGAAVIGGGIACFIKSNKSPEAEKIKLERQREQQQYEEKRRHEQQQAEENRQNKQREEELQNRKYREERDKQIRLEESYRSWNKIQFIANQFESVFKQMETSSFSIDQIAHTQDKSHGISPFVSLDEQLLQLIDTIKYESRALSDKEQLVALEIITKLATLKSHIDPVKLRQECEEAALRNHNEELRHQEIRRKKQEVSVLLAQQQAEEERKKAEQQRGRKHIRAQEIIDQGVQTIRQTQKTAEQAMTNTGLATVAAQVATASELKTAMHNVQKQITQEIKESKNEILDDAQARGQQANNHGKAMEQKIDDNTNKLKEMDGHLDTINTNLGTISGNLETVNDNLHVKS